MAKNIFLDDPLDAVLAGSVAATAPEESTAKQAPTPATDTPAVSAGSGRTAGGSLPPPELIHVFNQISEKYDVPVNVLMAMADQESGYNSKAVGTPTKWGTAKGMMQYLDSTAKGRGIDSSDPIQSITAAAEDISSRLKKGYSMEDAVKEHFAGPDRKQWGKKTAVYGKEVLGRAGTIGDQLLAMSGNGKPKDAAGSSDTEGLIPLTDEQVSNMLSTSMPRDTYQEALHRTNPKAPPEMFASAMADYDAEAKQRAAAEKSVDPMAATNMSADERFKAKLDARLKGPQNGIVPQLPGLAKTDSLAQDDTAKERPSILSQIGSDAKRGVSNLANTGIGLGALAAEGVGATDTADRWLKSYVTNVTELAKTNPAVIGTYKNVHDFGDAGRYAVEALAENIPMMIPTVLTGGFGATIARKVAEKGIAEFVAKEVAAGATKEVAEKAALKMATRATLKGSVAGAAPISIGIEGGSIFGDTYKETGVKAAGLSAAFAIPAGLLDTIEPVYALSKIAGPAVKELAGGIIRRLGVEAGKQFLIEGGTEGLQTMLEEAPTSIATGKPYWTKELLDKVIDAGLKGGIGGAGIGTATSAYQEGRNALANRGNQAQEAQVQPPPSPAAPAAPMSNAIKSVAATQGVTVVGDDGRSYQISTGPEGVKLTETPEAGPMTAALEETAAEEPAAPEVEATEEAAPEAAPIPDEPVIAPAVAAKVTANEVIDTDGVVHDRQKSAEQDADFASLSLGELETHLTAMKTQAKTSGGWNKSMIKQRKLVAAEIAKRKQETPPVAPVAKATEDTETSFTDRSDANSAMLRAAEKTGLPHEVVERDGYFDVKPIQEVAQNAENEPDIIGRAEPVDGNGLTVETGRADVGDISGEGSGNTVASLGETGHDNAGVVKPADGKPALENKVSDAVREKALKRIARGTAFFGTEEKAQQYVEDNGLTDTHTVEQTGKVKFSITAKPVADVVAGKTDDIPTSAQDSQVATPESKAEDAAQPETIEPQPETPEPQPETPEPQPETIEAQPDVEGTTPNIDEVKAETVTANNLSSVKVGDTIQSTGDVGYMSGNTPMRVTEIEKNGTVHVENIATGGKTTINKIDLKVADRQRVTVGKVEPTEPESAKPTAEEEAATLASTKAAAEQENRRAGREISRNLYSEMTALPELANKTPEEILKELNKRMKARDSWSSLNTAQKFSLSRAIYKNIKKNNAELEKQKHRDPAVKQDAIVSAVAGHYDGTEATGEQQSAFMGGFNHAMGGKTKSTLTGEFMGDMQAGYEAAQEWLKTEDGAAWFEGRASKQLQNTGVDLRRHWELLREKIKSDETDVDKAWAAIEKATTRADLFAPFLPDGVTPGMRTYVTDFRAEIQPFKKWLFSQSWYGAGAWRSKNKAAEDLKFVLSGEKYPGSLNETDREKFESDSQYRIEFLQAAAADYVSRVEKLTAHLVGAKSVDEAAKNFESLFIKPEELPAIVARGYVNSNNLTEEANKGIGRGGVWPNNSYTFGNFRSGSDYVKNLAINEETIKLPDRATPMSAPKLDRVTRDGLKDHRNGKNVTPAEFKAKFGFADVGFGKYVNSKQDQDHLNYAYDAFMDLSKQFGINPSDVGFGGRLHFTIGALGHGKAAAHFSPNQPSPTGPVAVINLTNTKGDGTVFHEWTHALDHFLGGEWASGVRGKFLNTLKYKPISVEFVEKTARRFLVGGTYWRGNKNGSKIDAAILGINHYIGSRLPETAYKQNSDKLGKDYWGNNEELIARASEAWVVDTLGGTNTYLVNPAWAGDGMVTSAKGYRGTPYPTGTERADFAVAYRALVESIKWVDGNPTVTIKDYNAAIPKGSSMELGEARRQELQSPEEMQRFADQINQEASDKASLAAAEKDERERIAQEEMDRLAADKLAELVGDTIADPVIDPPSEGEKTGPLTDSDLSALFDEAAAELRESEQEKPDAPAPGSKPEATGEQPAAPKKPAKPKADKPTDQPDPNAAKLIAEAAKLGVKGIDEALGGLSALFGPPGRLNSFPGGFDEEAYQQAKPHFESSLKAFQEAGKNLKDLFKMLIQHFGDGVKDYAIRFAKDQNLTTNLGSKTSASKDVAFFVGGKISARTQITWRELFAVSDKAWGGTQAQGTYTPKDAYDAMEAGVNNFLQKSAGREFNPNVNVETALYNIGELERITALLPTQTKRTEEQEEFQQFSTVPALAYAANWVANVTDADTMLEPSAGIGGLAVFAKNAGAKLVLNELSSRRAAVLQEVFPNAKVFTENAEQINNVLPESILPSVVVMNPPFSASAGRMNGKRDTQIGAQHVEQALARLADGGRLVAIVGDGMAIDRPAFKAWWEKIGAKYNVRAVVPMDGSGYAKYGTTFDNVLIVIDKVAPTNEKTVTNKVSNYTELTGLLEGIRNDRPEPSVPATTDDAIDRVDAESAHFDAVQSEQGINVAGDAGGGTSSLGSGKPTKKPRVGTKGSGDDSASNNGRSAGADGRTANTEDTGSGDARGGRNNDAATTGGSNTTGITIASEEVKSTTFTDSIYENYQPQRLQVPGALPHPGALVQSAAMASVLPPAATYVPNLPKKTITDGLLSIAQIEAVVYAGQAHAEMLPSTPDKPAARRGYFIGDGTGVGKGREIGGIILDNIRQGRKKAIWISEKQGLMEDAKRDFSGVGGDDSIIFNQSGTKATDSIKQKDGILFTTYSTLRSGAQGQKTSGAEKLADILKAKYPVGSQHEFTSETSGRTFNVNIDKIDVAKNTFMVTVVGNNYSVPAGFDKLAAIDGNADWKAAPPLAKKKADASQSRADQLAEWMGEDYDGVIAFDEAHNAGNAVVVKGARGPTEPSAQALEVVEIQRRFPNARVVYVSATGATQVSNLSYATRLGLWGTGTPFPSVESFISEISAGGLASMELVARDMKQMGSYLSRSLSFDGVTYSRIEHELTPIQRDIYNRMAEGWQVTLQNIDQALELTGVTKNGKGGGKAKSSARAAYWGAQQRFFNQVITSMQMPTVIDQIESDIAAGEAVVLQLVSTNEAQQNRAIAKRKEEGESVDLEDLDLTPRDQLIEMVKKSFPIIQYESYIDENSKTQQRPATDSNGNIVESREAIAMRDKLVNDLEKIKVPDGPLELLINHFGAKVVAEITGRTQRIVRKPDAKGEMKAQLERRSSASVRADADAFMNDKKQILIFSDAGGTGFSFHASLKEKNQRKRKHYLIQPGWRADKAVQGFGRTHRTAEKSAPHYFLASTDIPAQKRFLSAIARRLDQLGALTKGQRDTASQGMFSEKDNLESVYATDAVAQFFKDANRNKVEGVDFKQYLKQTGLEDIVDENGQIAEGKIPTIRLFLNRMLSLTLEMQDVAFKGFIQRMEEKIDVAVQRGEFDAGMQTIRALKSTVISDEIAYSDPHSGAETRLIELELTQPTKNYPIPKDSEKTTWLVNNKSGRVWARLESTQTRTLKDGSISQLYSMIGSGSRQIKEADEFAKNGGVAPYKTITHAEAQTLWADEIAKRPPTYTQRTHMVVGAMLPIWDRLKTTGNINVARTQTEDGQRLLGMVVGNGEVAELRKRLSLTSPAAKMKPVDVMAAILKGSNGELANGWNLVRARVSGELRIELKVRGHVSSDAAQELVAQGVIQERIEWTNRYFVPVGKDGVPVLEQIFKSKPLVDITNPDSKNDNQDGGVLGAESRQVGGSNDAKLFQQVSAGTTAKSILENIASTTTDTGYKQLANRLLATGVAPKVILSSAAGLDIKHSKSTSKFDGAYDPKTNTVMLFNLKGAERVLLHEMVHAATAKALRMNGHAAQQMKALFNHVKNTTNLRAYGMVSVDEFVTEGFTRPEFQAELRKIPAPAGVFKNAWDKFVNTVRSIVGLPIKSNSVLDRVMALQEGLFSENNGTTGKDTMGSAGSLATDTAAFKKWFGDSKAVDSKGNPQVMYHGTRKDFSKFSKTEGNGLLGDGIYVTSSVEEASETYAGEHDGANVMPLYVKIENPFISEVGHDVPLDWERQGYDGVILNNKRDGKTWYVVANPNQVKSATGNNGNFDAANPSILGSADDDLITSPSLTPPPQGFFRRFQARVQDNKNRLRQVQDRIMEVTGVKHLGMADHYGAETNRPGRIAARLEDAEKQMSKPLMQRIAKSGFKPEDVAELLHAQHAGERNAKVASINAEMDPSSGEYSGTQGSGMNDDVAAQILEKYKDETELHAIARQVRSVAVETLEAKVAYGLITQDTVDTLMDAYEFYVPLKGDSEYGPKIKRAMGHEGRDEHILENIFRDYYQAVVFGEKNLARQSLLTLIAQNPDPELWTIGVPPKGRRIVKQGGFYVAYKDGTILGKFKTEAQAEQQSEMWAEWFVEHATNYEVGKNSSDIVSVFDKQLQDNEIMVYVEGQPVRLQINDPTLAKQLRPLDQGQMNAVMEFMRGLNRYLSKIYTGYNPAFILRNATRDAMTGTINVIGHHGTVTMVKVWARYPMAVKTLGQWAATGKIPQGESGKMLTEYRMNGGKVGASWMPDIEEHGKTLERLYDDAYGVSGYLSEGKVGKAAVIGARKAIGSMAHVVEIANQATENGLRLALYMELRKQGVTPSIAAQAAKQVTVDFDRKGTATNALGAFYLFANPAIQGTTNAAKTITQGEHKYQAWAAISLLPALGLLAASMGFDDDKDRWLGRNWSNRTKNFIVQVGSKEIRIPLSQEYAPFFASGVALGEALQGEPAMRSSVRMVSSFIDAYVPMQGAFEQGSDNAGGDLALAMVPTLAQPPVRSIFNRNSAGYSIVPDSDFVKDRPDNQKMRRNTKGSVFDAMAQGIAKAGEATGAGAYENDITKVSPETLKMLWHTYTGGLGTFITDSVGLASMSVADSEGITTSKVPIVKDFVRDTTTQPLESRFYELAKGVRAASLEFKLARKAGDDAAMDKIERDPTKDEYLGLTKLVSSTAKDSAQIKDDMVEVSLDKTLSAAEKRVKLKALEAENEAVLREGINAFKP